MFSFLDNQQLPDLLVSPYASSQSPSLNQFDSSLSLLPEQSLDSSFNDFLLFQSNQMLQSSLSNELLFPSSLASSETIFPVSTAGPTEIVSDINPAFLQQEPPKPASPLLVPSLTSPTSPTESLKSSDFEELNTLNPTQILQDLSEYNALRAKLKVLHDRLTHQEALLRKFVNSGISADTLGGLKRKNTDSDISFFPTSNKKSKSIEEPLPNLQLTSGLISEISEPITVGSPTPSSVSDSNKNVCNECGKSFSKKFNLQQHMKLHQEKGLPKPYLCTEPGCTLSFSREYDLKRHYLTVHESQENLPYACPVDGCGRKFPRKDVLGRHVKKHH